MIEFDDRLEKEEYHKEKARLSAKDEYKRYGILSLYKYSPEKFTDTFLGRIGIPILAFGFGVVGFRSRLLNSGLCIFLIVSSIIWIIVVNYN